jgi:hypothetical protein
MAKAGAASAIDVFALAERQAGDVLTTSAVEISRSGGKPVVV